jgi:predicted nucleotidyltransferase component of viral defense system
MEFKGFELEFKFIEKMAFHCYIRFPDILFENKLSPNKDEKLLIRIDTVNKEKNITPEITILNNFDVYRQILVNPISTILAQKIIAILERKREKGRDFYDVSYLLGLTEPDYEFIRNNRGWSKEEVKAKLLARTDEVNLKDLAEDVIPFLLKPDDTERILTFRQYIEQKL